MFATLFSLTCLVTQAGVQEDSHARLPLLGTVHKNILYGFFGNEGDFSLDAIPAKNPPRARSRGYLIGLGGKNPENPNGSGWKCYFLLWGQGIGYGENHYRHQIGYDSIWISAGFTTVSRLKFEELNMFDTSNKDFAEQYSKKSQRTLGSPMAFHEIERPTILEKYRRSRLETEGNAVPGPRARNVLGIGSVATSNGILKCFMLAKPSEFLELWDTHFRWDDNIQRWKTTADGKNSEKIGSLFAEDFHFFVRNDDYFFVTQSGKLYIAPPKKKGEKSRTMQELWWDAKRPIVAVIEDADRDKVWLFAKDKNRDAKYDLYFEMKEPAL